MEEDGVGLDRAYREGETLGSLRSEHIENQSYQTKFSCTYHYFYGSGTEMLDISGQDVFRIMYKT